MTVELAEWPSVRDVCRQLDISQAYVSLLIKRGQLLVTRTRAGILVDPMSVQAFATVRAARKAAKA